MKINKIYMWALAIFFCLVTTSLVKQYPHFKFQLSHIDQEQAHCFQGQNNNDILSGYFADENLYFGGGKISLHALENVQSPFICQVILENQTIIEHQMTEIEAGVYLLDAKKITTFSKPKEACVINANHEEITRIHLEASDAALYQATGYEYALSHVFFSESGVFMGHFDAFKKDELQSKYSQVTIEFCLPDASTSSGYQLLARYKTTITELLETPYLGFIPYVNDHRGGIETGNVILSFEGDKTQTIVMNLIAEVN